MAQLPTIKQSILAINSNAQFKIDDDDVNKIEWLAGTTVLTKSAIETKQAELQTAYDSEAWKRNRQTEYPNHEDCIHALLDGGDTLTDLQAKRTIIKDKYPKS